MLTQKNMSILREKRINLVFREDEMEIYNNLVKQSKLTHLSKEDTTKRILRYYQRLNDK
jgi:hypothetical protein